MQGIINEEAFDHQTLINRYIEFHSKQKELSKKQQLMNWVVKIAKWIKNAIMFIPQIFMQNDSQFVKIFMRSDTYAILSNSKLPQTIEIATHLKIPLLVIYWTGQQQHKNIILSLIQQYEIANFFNQSFMVYGLLPTDKDFSKLGKDIERGPGLYFIRKNMFDQIKIYAFIEMKSIQISESLGIMKQLKLYRKCFYDMTLLEIQFQNQVKKKQGSTSEEIEEKIEQVTNNYQENQKKYIQYLQNEQQEINNQQCIVPNQIEEWIESHEMNPHQEIKNKHTDQNKKQQ